MESDTNQPPLIAIVGETASGKSALAMRVAREFDGEIVCADSRTIYKGMDIGTAKPSLADQTRVRHHLLDVVAPDELFTAFDFKHLADIAIADILKRGKLPLLVGGTGLYVDAVLYDFQFRSAANPAQRAVFQKMSVEELQGALRAADIPLPSNERNPRHLVRALETSGQVTSRSPLRSNTLIVGLQIAREELESNVVKRVDEMLQAGFVEEVRHLAHKYSVEQQAFQAPGYKALSRYLNGEATLHEARGEFIHADLQLARRQRTWFKRNKSIHWVQEQAEAVELITTFLNK